MNMRVIYHGKTHLV